MKIKNKKCLTQRPYFSIITCTLNSGKHLSACIDSVQSQTLGDYEHLIIDGFSEDETSQIIKAYKKHEPARVKIYKMKASGVTRAMNKGVRFSAGKVILHLHSDDYLTGQDVLRTVKRLFDTTSATVISGDCRLEGNPVLRHTWPENRIARALYKAVMPFLMFYVNPIAHPSTYVAREVFDRNGGFDGSYQVVMDYEFWLRILKKERFLITDEILSIYRFHPDTISTRQMELGLREIDRIHAIYRKVYPIRHFFYASVLRPLLLAGKALRWLGLHPGNHPPRKQPSENTV